jgi:hypothetical protein
MLFEMGGQSEPGLAARDTPTSPTSQISATAPGSGGMAFKSRIVGRVEKRLPIAIVVRLAPAQHQSANGAEMTYTDNVSVHGARVVSTRSWQAGDMAQVTSLKDEITLSGKVVYCHKLQDHRYLIGLNFLGRRVTWSAYNTYSNT